MPSAHALQIAQFPGLVEELLQRTVDAEMPVQPLAGSVSIQLRSLPLGASGPMEPFFDQTWKLSDLEPIG